MFHFKFSQSLIVRILSFTSAILGWISNLDQTRTAPELALPLQAPEPRQRDDVFPPTYGPTHDKSSWNRVQNLKPSGSKAEIFPLLYRGLDDNPGYCLYESSSSIQQQEKTLPL
ncbi:hypothetical protein AVEN_60851-1 [Araneus ventricosus]|uniref:Uncharacterized protein n=1 Tax=Araneus ventricosus TaxID=182803 RepID=A0A4Y2NMH6_ARAVE|nr:hypothetical protein AVEN_60851-1 [Araneus ventricosus]